MKGIIPLTEISSGAPFGFYIHGHHDAAAFIERVNAEYDEDWKESDVLFSHARVVPLPKGWYDTDNKVLFNQKPGHGAFPATYVLYD